VRPWPSPRKCRPGVLQCAAVCCSVLQCAAACCIACNQTFDVSVYLKPFEYAHGTHTLQHSAANCNTLQHTTAYCNTLVCIWYHLHVRILHMHCNTAATQCTHAPQHTAAPYPLCCLSFSGALCHIGSSALQCAAYTVVRCSVLHIYCSALQCAAYTVVRCSVLHIYCSALQYAAVFCIICDVVCCSALQYAAVFCVICDVVCCSVLQCAAVFCIICAVVRCSVLHILQ